MPYILTFFSLIPFLSSSFIHFSFPPVLTFSYFLLPSFLLFFLPPSFILHIFLLYLSFFFSHSFVSLFLLHSFLLSSSSNLLIFYLSFSLIPSFLSSFSIQLFFLSLITLSYCNIIFFLSFLFFHPLHYSLPHFSPLLPIPSFTSSSFSSFRLLHFLLPFTRYSPLCLLFSTSPPFSHSSSLSSTFLIPPNQRP